MSSKTQQSKSTAHSWSEIVNIKGLNIKEIKKAKRVALAETKSLQAFVKNGVVLHSNGSVDEKTADEELVRAALHSIEDMPITQSSIAVLISALHKVAMEAKWDIIVDMQETIL